MGKKNHPQNIYKALIYKRMEFIFFEVVITLFPKFFCYGDWVG
jgi:hypothetical protein